MGCLSTCGLWAASWLSCWPGTRCYRAKTKLTSSPASSSSWACPARSSSTPPRGPRTLCHPKVTHGIAPSPRCPTAPPCWTAAAHGEGRHAARRAARTGARRWKAATTHCSWTSSNSVWSGTRLSGWCPARRCATPGWGGDSPSRQQEPPREKRPPPPNVAPPPPTAPSPPSPNSPPPPQPPRPPPPKPGLTWQRSPMPTETSSHGRFCPSWSAESERTPLAVVGVVMCAHEQPWAASRNWIQPVRPVLKSVWFFSRWFSQRYWSAFRTDTRRWGVKMCRMPGPGWEPSWRGCVQNLQSCLKYLFLCCEQQDRKWPRTVCLTVGLLRQSEHTAL